MRGSLCPQNPGHSPVHTPHELLQLPHAGPGLEVLHTWLSIRPDVHIELSLISLGVHQSWLAGQDEWAQPDGVDLRGQGSRLVCPFPAGSRQRPVPPTSHKKETLSLQPSLEAPSCSFPSSPARSSHSTSRGHSKQPIRHHGPFSLLPWLSGPRASFYSRRN